MWENKTEKRMYKSLKNGIKDAKEGKITTVEELKEILKEPKSKIYEIYLYFYRLFWRLVRLPGDIRRGIKFFIQRGVRGYSDRDTWGFDYYLAQVISGGIKYLKANCHSMPTWRLGKTELEAINEWDNILNTIINTFNIAKKISESRIIYLPIKKWSEKKYKQYNLLNFLKRLDF